MTCPRNLYSKSQIFINVDNESNGIDFNDTNCYLIHRSFFNLISNWMFKNKKECFLGDRIFWNFVKQSGAKILRSQKPTVNYTTNFIIHYLKNNLEPPEDSKAIVISADNEYKIINYKEYKKIIKN